MKMVNCCTVEDNIYKKLFTIFLKLLLISILLFVNKYVYDFRVNQEAVIKLFTIILLTIWITKIINNGKYYLRKTRLDQSVILFILVIAISILISDVKIISLREFIIFSSYFLIFLLIVNNIDNKKIFNSFIYLFFTISSLVSIYTVMQYYGIDPYLSDLHSLTSTIGQKNWISNYLAMIFPVLFSYFLSEKIRKKIIYFFLLSILYATLMICQSRGIWISISITVILAIYIIFKLKFYEIFKINKKWLFLLLITFLIITIIYSTDNPLNKSAITVLQRAISTFDENDPSINTRLLIWKTTLEMIKDRPIFGSGIGTFKMNYLNYQAEFLRKNPGYIKYSGKAGEAHNEYLQIWAELGIIGLALFLLIFYFFYKTIIDFYKSSKNIKDKTIMLGLVMGITCFLIHCLFSFPLHVPALGITFFAIMGLTVVYMRKTNLYEIGSDNCLKEVKLINKKIKIAFSILIFIFMIFAVNLLVIKPYIAELYYFKGMRYNVDKNYTKSLPNFQYAVQLDPYNGRILHALGTTYYNLNIFSKAEEILQKAKKYMIDVNTFCILGLSYSKLNMFKEAEEEFKQAIYLNPKFTEGYHYLGLLYFQQEDYDKAVEQWNKILKIEPDFPNKYIVLNNLGIVYNKKEMPDKALEYFVQALQLVPEGDPIEKEIEEEINKIYKSNLKN
jgi:O-antigen ligase/Tfp pilus assembly protein PilF